MSGLLHRTPTTNHHTMEGTDMTNVTAYEYEVELPPLFQERTGNQFWSTTILAGSDDEACAWAPVWRENLAGTLGTTVWSLGAVHVRTAPVAIIERDADGVGIGLASATYRFVRKVVAS
jgi:hypothetical protein